MVAWGSLNVYYNLSIAYRPPKQTSMHTIGIDFGTTKTLVSRIKAKTGEAETVRLGQGKDHISTSVFIANNGEMCFGDDADDRISDPDGTYLRGFKMHLGYSTPELSIADEEGELISYTAADIVTHYLRHIRQRVQETVFAGQPVTHVTITRPVNFTAAPCEELRKAALNAGFEHVELTTEPEAAGLAFCRLNDAEAFRHSALIVDWGGGTLDFALVTRENDRIVTHPHLTDGDMSLGGDLFDQQLWDFAISELFQKGVSELNHITAMPIVRKNKEKLSSMTATTMRFPHGQGTCPPISLTRDLFNQLIEEHVEKAADKIMRLLEKVPQEDKPEVLLLVGGSCKIPLIQTKLEEICNLPAKSWHLSREAVALGAALWEENVTIIPVIPNEEQPTIIDSPIEEEKTEEEPAPITPMEDVAPLIAPDIPEEESVEWPVSDISEEKEEDKESTPVEEPVSEPAQLPAPQKRSRLLPLALLMVAATVPAYFYLAPLYTEETQATQTEGQTNHVEQGQQISNNGILETQKLLETVNPDHLTPMNTDHVESSSVSTPEPSQGEQNAAYIPYTIQTGDTLYRRIAEQFNVTFKDIIAINPGFDPNNIIVGETLRIPKKDTSSISFSSEDNFVTYRLRKGDTLPSIAGKAGVKGGYLKLMEINNFTDGDIRRLRPGIEIKLPNTPKARQFAEAEKRTSLIKQVSEIITETKAATESLNASTCTQQQLDYYKNKLQAWRAEGTEARKKAEKLQSTEELSTALNNLAKTLSTVDEAIKNTESRIKREAEAAAVKAAREAAARKSASDKSAAIATARTNAQNLLSKLQNGTCTEEELNSIPAQQEAWKKELNSATNTAQQVAAIISNGTELDSLRSENTALSNALAGISTELPKAINRLKETKLLAAAGNGKAQETQTLLDQGMRSDLTDGEGNSLMHLAAKSGNWECLQVIRKAGGSINATNKAGQKPYDVAVGDCRKTLAQAELTAMGISAGQYNEKLVSHISPKDKSPRSEEEVARTLNLLLDAGANINYQRHSDKTTPLIMAACHSKVCLTELLKRQDLNIDLQDSEGRSALSYTAHFGETEMLKLLLQAGAKTSVIDEEGHTPLTIAVKMNKKDCVRELLNHGADVNYKRKSDGLTPLMFAACYSDDCLKELLKHHSISESLNLSDHEKRTALHYAAAEAAKERVKMLLEAGASVSIKDSSGNTPRDVIGYQVNPSPKKAVINEIKALLDEYKNKNSR